MELSAPSVPLPSAMLSVGVDVSIVRGRPLDHYPVRPGRFSVGSRYRDRGGGVAHGHVDLVPIGRRIGVGRRRVRQRGVVVVQRSGECHLRGGGRNRGRIGHRVRVEGGAERRIGNRQRLERRVWSIDCLLFPAHQACLERLLIGPVDGHVLPGEARIAGAALGKLELDAPGGERQQRRVDAVGKRHPQLPFAGVVVEVPGLQALAAPLVREQVRGSGSDVPVPVVGDRHVGRPDDRSGDGHGAAGQRRGVVVEDGRRRLRLVVGAELVAVARGQGDGDLAVRLVGVVSDGVDLDCRRCRAGVERTRSSAWSR